MIDGDPRGCPSGRVDRYDARTTRSRASPDGVPVDGHGGRRPDEATIEVDLRDNLDCLPCGLNLTEATASAGGDDRRVQQPRARTCRRTPGSFRRAARPPARELRRRHPAPPGELLGCDDQPRRQGGNAVHAAIAELGEGFGMAEVGRTQPPAWRVISGVDPRRAARRSSTRSCSPRSRRRGAPSADGWLTILLAGVGDAGMLWRDSVELDELASRSRSAHSGSCPDSEGAGRFRGAPAAYVEYGPVGTQLEVDVRQRRHRQQPPRGVRGGLDGAPARAVSSAARRRQLDELPSLRRRRARAGRDDHLDCSRRRRLRPADTSAIRRPCAETSLEGWITRARAGDVYRVVLDDPGRGRRDRHVTIARDGRSSMKGVR